MSIRSSVQIGTQTGLIDAHVHLAGLDALLDLAHAGIAAVRDAGTRQGAGLALKHQSEQGGSPVVITAGRALSKRGGYGAFLGTPVETRQEIAAEILKLRNEGADILKVIASGVMSLEQPGIVTPGGFSADDIRFIVEEAGRHGLAVMAHANGEAAIRAAAGAGVRSIEHGFTMTDAALEVLAERQVFWVPTIGALRRAADAAGVSSDVRSFITTTIEDHLKMVLKAFALGVPLAIGTDCVLPDPRYGEAYEAELAFFRRAGISADDVHRIAVEGGQELLGPVQPRMDTNKHE
jgi:imidazolonepropionase-like amidohydrolase